MNDQTELDDSAEVVRPDEMTNDDYDPSVRNLRDAGHVIVQKGKTFTSMPNPQRGSLLKYVYKNEEGRQVCSAMRASGKNICTSIILNESGRCKNHGGMSLSGVAHPGFKKGRFSKALPSRLIERYEEALEDDKLADFTEDLAVIDARLSDLLLSMDEGGGAQIFREVKESFESFQVASSEGDTQAMRESLRRLDSAIKRGGKEAYLWSELRQLQEQRRKIILAQAKHLQLTNQTVTVTKVNLLISALLDAVRRNVGDPKTLRDINNEFLRITGAGSRKPAELTA